MKWPNHYPCPFFTYIETVHHAVNYLIMKKEHVVSVHCLAGKGRTGSLICGILYVSGKFKTMEEIINYYLCKRAVTVTRASQIRYLDYFASFYDKGLEEMFLVPKTLKKIIVTTKDKDFLYNYKLKFQF